MVRSSGAIAVAASEDKLRGLVPPLWCEEQAEAGRANFGALMTALSAWKLCLRLDHLLRC